MGSCSVPGSVPAAEDAEMKVPPLCVPLPRPAVTPPWGSPVSSAALLMDE